MNEQYKKPTVLPEGLSPLEPCPVCGADAELWEYSDDFKNGPIQKVVMCSNEGAIGPRDGNLNEGCLLLMPPQDFYKDRFVTAVNYWNDYAKALMSMRIRNGLHGLAVKAQQAEFSDTLNQETRDQLASVMLQHGTPKQQQEALNYVDGHRTIKARE